jgi:hypothetical protein
VGTRSRIANAAWTPAQVEQALASVFPTLKEKVLTLVTLATEDEVKAVEQFLSAH